jgi:HEAT repeat protein
VDTPRHSECERRRAAIDLLVEFDARGHLPEIERLAKDPEWQVRASVAYALRQWGARPRLLARLAKDPHPAVGWRGTP